MSPARYPTYLTDDELKEDRLRQYDEQVKRIPKLDVPQPPVFRSPAPPESAHSRSGYYGTPPTESPSYDASEPMPAAPAQPYGTPSEPMPAEPAPRGESAMRQANNPQEALRAYDEYIKSKPPLSLNPRSDMPTTQQSRSKRLTNAERRQEAKSNAAVKASVTRLKGDSNPVGDFLGNVGQAIGETDLMKGVGDVAGRADMFARENVPGYAGYMDTVQPLQAEWIAGPQLRGEAYQPGGMINPGFGATRIAADLMTGQSLEQAAQSAAQRWHETPEAFPTQKGMLEMLVPTEMVLNALPDPIFEGVPMAARFAGKGVKKAAPVVGKGLRAAGEAAAPAVRSVEGGLSRLGETTLPTAQRLATEEGGYLKLPEFYSEGDEAIRWPTAEQYKDPAEALQALDAEVERLEQLGQQLSDRHNELSATVEYGKDYREVVRPPWDAGPEPFEKSSGRHYQWRINKALGRLSNEDLYQFARETGRNPFEPEWWDSVDSQHAQDWATERPRLTRHPGQGNIDDKSPLRAELREAGDLANKVKLNQDRVMEEWEKANVAYMRGTTLEAPPEVVSAGERVAVSSGQQAWIERETAKLRRASQPYEVYQEPGPYGKVALRYQNKRKRWVMGPSHSRGAGLDDTGGRPKSIEGWQKIDEWTGEAEKVPEAPPAHENGAWQSRRDEYASEATWAMRKRAPKAGTSAYHRFDSEYRKARDRALEAHRASVESALSEGKPVPPEVLADYPDLAAKATSPVPTENVPIEGEVGQALKTAAPVKKQEKELWQMGWYEYGYWLQTNLPPRQRYKLTMAIIKDNHKRMLQQALSEGKPVPPEVLTDYPDLTAKHGQLATPSEPAALPKVEEQAAVSVTPSSYERQGHPLGWIVEQFDENGLAEPAEAQRRGVFAVLDGFRDEDEVLDWLEVDKVRDGQGVLFTAHGWQIDGDTLREALDLVRRNPELRPKGWPKPSSSTLPADEYLAAKAQGGEESARVTAEQARRQAPVEDAWHQQMQDELARKEAAAQAEAGGNGMGGPPEEPPVAQATPEPEEAGRPVRPDDVEYRGENDEGAHLWRLRGTGRWELDADLEDEAIAAYKAARLGRETITWDETEALAKSAGLTPDELAAKFKDAPQADLSREFLVLKAGTDANEREIGRLETMLEREGATMAEDARAQAVADLGQAKLRRVEYWAALNRRGSEFGRALNILKMSSQGKLAEIAVESYKNTRRLVDRVDKGLKRAQKNGKVDDGLRGMLEDLAKILEREANDGPPDVSIGGAASQKKASDIEQLAERVVELNTNAQEARRAGRLDEFDAISEQRDGLLSELDEALRKSIERKLEKAAKEPAEMTEAAADKAYDALIEQMRQRVVKQLIRDRSSIVKQEVLGQGKLLSQTEKAVQRKTEQGLVNESLKDIKRLLDIDPEDATIRREVDLQLRELSTVSGYADVLVKRFRDRLEEQGAKPVPRMRQLARQMLDLTEQKIKARAAGDWDAFDRAVNSLETLGRHLDDEIAADLQEKLRAKATKELTDREQEFAEIGMRRDMRERAAGKLIGMHTKRVKEKMTGQGGMLAGIEKSAQAKLDRAFAKDAIESIRTLLQAAPDSRQVRETVDTLLLDLSTVSGYADQQVRHYREAANIAMAKHILGKDAELTESVLRQVQSIDWTDPRAIAAFADAVSKPMSLWRYLQTFRIASMLSGTPTLQVQATGNILESATSVPVAYLSAAMDAVFPIVGGQRTATKAMADARWRAMRAALPEAINEFRTTLRTGLPMRPLRDMSLFHAKPFKGKLAPMNYILHYMAAIDDFSRTLNRAGSLAANAVLEAERKGTTVDDILTNLVDNPQLVQRAEKDAARLTYTSEMKASGQAIQQLRGSRDLVGFGTGVLVPFFETIWNMGVVGLAERTPYGFVKAHKLLREGKVEEALALRTEATVGSAIMGYGVWAGYTGSMTGYGPADERERRDWRDQGGQSFSARIGNQWVSYQNLLGAWGIPLAMGVVVGEALREAERAARPVEPGLGQAMVYIQTALVQSSTRMPRYWVDLSAMKGVGDFFKAVEDPEAGVENLAEGLTASMVPVGGLLATIARMFDPGQKSPKGLVEAVKARLPGLSRDVPNMTTQLGDEMVRTSSGALALFPIRTIETKRDAVYDEYQRLRDAGHPVGIGFAGDTIYGIKLSPEEHAEYRKLAGKRVRADLKAALASPRYQAAPDALKAEILDYIVRSSRQAAGEEYLLTLPLEDVRARYAQAHPVLQEVR
jgi:hypothetical protein